MSKTVDHLPCLSCDNVWFELSPAASLNGLPPKAAVTVAPDGSVRAYSGDLVCSMCGRRYAGAYELREAEARPALRIVRNS